MTIKQTVEIPANHRLTIDIPPEVPEGKAILTLTPAAEAPILDETEYLLHSPANREHLEKAMKEEKMISFETIEEARQCAEEWVAEN